MAKRTSWSPATVLGIGKITKDFCCVGATAKLNKHHAPTRCANPINEANRKKAKVILEDMGLLNIHTDCFRAITRELADALLCPARKNYDHRSTQRESQAEEWQGRIDEHAKMTRRDSDTIMGEAGDTIWCLRQRLDETEILLQRMRISM